VRLVPIVLDVTGFQGVRFTSQLFLVNRGTTNATAELLYTPATALLATGGGTVTVAVPAGRQVVIDDVIAFLRAGGLSISLDPPQGGSLRVTFRDVSSPEVAFASVRTTAPSGPGRAGLAYPAPAPGETYTGTTWLYGLRENAADRTNLALVNFSDAPMTFHVSLFSGVLGENGRGPALDPDLTLGPGQWAQIGSVLARASPPIAQGYARVDVVKGSGPYLAYAVFNDNGTNDGSYVTSEPNVVVAEPGLLPVLVETRTFASELVLTNAYETEMIVTLTYTESRTPAQGIGGSINEVLAPLEQRIIPNALDHMRRKGIGIGPKGGDFAGGLFVRYSGGTGTVAGYSGARTAAASRTGPGGYGLYYPTTPVSRSAAGDAWVYGLVQDASSRSNVAIANVGERGGIIGVRLEVYDGTTGRLAGGSPEVLIAPRGWVQFEGVLAQLGLAQGYVRVVRTQGVDGLAAYGVVNDGPTPGAGTDDGSFVPFSVR